MRRACHSHARVACPICTSRPARNGSTRAWREIRAVVLDRDAYACQVGLPGCTIIATHVDHVVPRSAGGTDNASNLRAACAHCNLTRGDAPVGAVIKDER